MFLDQTEGLISQFQSGQMFRTTINFFLKSRQQLLIKRRKRQLKNRPLSQKRLKEERQHINVAYENKKLQILKSMDRVQNPNTHINEIVEELFYPELRFNNAEEVDQRVRQVTSSSIGAEDEWEELVEKDSITGSLWANALPLELLSVHEQKGEDFTAEHYLNLLSKMNYYVFNREKVKSIRTANWQKMIAKLKSKDKNAANKKCPYVFLEREEITRHEHWLNLIDKMREKIEKEEDVSVVNDYIYSLFTIRKTFHFLPAQLYQAILNKNAAVPVQSLSDEEVSDLLELMKSRGKLKFNPNVVIESPEDNLPKEYNHTYMARKLVSRVVDNPERFSVEDLVNIFKIINNRKMKMNLLEQEHFPKIEAIIQPILSDLSFEIVEIFLTTYCFHYKNAKKELIDILVYDLYRKAQQNTYHSHLYSLITRIKKRKLELRKWTPKGVPSETISIQAYDLLIRLSQVLVTLMEKMHGFQIVAFLNVLFDSDVRNKEIIEFVAIAIVKKGQQLGLEELAKALFQLTLLGHSSKVMAKYVFQQFDKKYLDQMKKYKEEGAFLLPTEEEVVPQTLNFKQIYLQECLLMVLWSVIRQSKDVLEKEIGTMKIMEIIPVKLQSRDPLPIELSRNINAALKSYSLFPKITSLPLQTENLSHGKYQQFYNRDFTRDSVELIMTEQAKESNLFVGNCNVKANMFIPERWSEQNTYSKKDYLDFCVKNKDKTEEGSCFFDPQVKLRSQFLEKRRKVIDNQLSTEKGVSGLQKKEEKEKEKGKGKKLYDLLL